MERIQVTIFCSNGKYRPISTLVKVENAEKELKENRKAIVQRGIENICHQKYTTIDELKRNGYSQIKTRVYKETTTDSREVEDKRALLMKAIEAQKEK